MGPQVTITPGDPSPAAAAVSAAVPSSVAFRLAKGEELIPGYVLRANGSAAGKWRGVECHGARAVSRRRSS